jgi:glyoxylase-like metal-dependent hydrolase (beta-lactamase superfamily II)
MYRRILGTIAVLTIGGIGSLPGQAPNYETTAAAEGIYSFRWVGHNGMFVVTPAGVVAFDPISVEAAATFASEIKRIAPGQPLVAVVYSHSDADHATGARAMISAMGQENVPIIAHELAVEPIRSRGNPEQPEPTVTFARRMAFAPGGRRIELHYLGRSHTDNMLVGFVPDAGIAFAVDFVAKDRMGYRDLASFYFPDQLNAIHRLLDLPFQTVMFGHGPPGDRAVIQRQLTYYDDLRAAVQAAIRKGLTEDQAAEQIRLEEYSSWGQYEAWFTMNVRGLYRVYSGKE